MQINPYLTFTDNCEEAFEFYKSVFGGEFTMLSRFGEIPESEEFPVTDEMKNLVMHVGLQVGDTTLMGSDNPNTEQTGPVVVGTNVNLSINLTERAEADRIFAALSEGGTVTMPLADQFWDSYFGRCTDKFGINWMINSDKEEK